MAILVSNTVLVDYIEAESLDIKGSRFIIMHIHFNRPGYLRKLLVSVVLPKALLVYLHSLVVNW